MDKEKELSQLISTLRGVMEDEQFIPNWEEADKNGDYESLELIDAIDYLKEKGYRDFLISHTFLADSNMYIYFWDKEDVELALWLYDVGLAPSQIFEYDESLGWNNLIKIACIENYY